MVEQTSDFRSSRYNAYVPACSYAADAIHGNTYHVYFGTPAVTAAAGILSANAITTANTVLAASMISGSSTSDARWGRNIRVIASGAATSTVTINGWDYLGQPMTETLTLNGANSVVSTKAFMWLRSIVFGATNAVTVDVGWGARFGVPYVVTHCVGETADGVAAAAGTLTAGIRTDPQTATTTDPRGLYTPTTTPDASKRLRAFFLISNFINSSGNGGLMGIKHYSA